LLTDKKSSIRPASRSGVGVKLEKIPEKDQPLIMVNNQAAPEKLIESLKVTSKQKTDQTQRTQGGDTTA
jgi:hypothetical protein